MGKSIKILNTNKIFYGEEIIRLIDFKVEGERMIVKKVELINRTENVLYADEHGFLIEKDYGTNVELEKIVEKIIYSKADDVILFRKIVSEYICIIILIVRVGYFRPAQQLG